MYNYSTHKPVQCVVQSLIPSTVYNVYIYILFIYYIYIIYILYKCYIYIYIYIHICMYIYKMNIKHTLYRELQRAT